LTGRAAERLRLNPRKSWWNTIAEIATDSHPCAESTSTGDPRLDRLGLHAGLPLPCFAARYAAAPDRFVEFKPNESIRLARNPDYWKPGRPYLDGIEYTIIPNRSTAILAFAAGKFDLTFPYEVTVPLMKDVKSQAPQAVCELVPTNASTNLLVNREAPPFDNPDLRRALALALDRKRFIDILAEGQGDIGGAMLPPPAGVWGMPPDILATIPGYGSDIAKNRAEAREIMERLGYGPDKRLAIKVAARNIAGYRDPAIILIDQLKEIGIDGELEPIETANWFPKLARKDYQIGLNNTGSGVDDPDQQFFENYGCSSERNYTATATPISKKRFVEQSEIADRDKRRHLVWDINKQLQEDGARPIIYHTRAATCMQPQVKGLTIMVNSQYNGWRMEDVWLDR
jgi:peptide/nickel transport system substrate-binding protein